MAMFAFRLRVISEVGSVVSRTRSSKLTEIRRDDTEADPSVHPRCSVIATAAQPVRALHDADAALTSGTPLQCAAIPPVTSLRRHSPCDPREDHPAHPELARDAFVSGRGKSRIGDRQAGWPSEERDVPFERRPPEIAIGPPGGTDFVVGDDPAVGFLDLHDVAEFGRLRRLALADDPSLPR